MIFREQVFGKLHQATRFAMMPTISTQLATAEDAPTVSEQRPR
jgi:hypothetical protein